MNTDEARRAFDDATRSGVVRVGDGRGFVVDARRRGSRVVVTAGHCLPELPPVISLVDERTYGAIIGACDGELTVPAECLFVDLIANLAILGTPDNRAYPAQCASFNRFVEARTAFQIAFVDDRAEATVRLLSLEGEWLTAQMTSFGEGLFVSDCEIASAMVGSPVVMMDGAAVGVVGPESDMPMTRLGDRLPGWLLSQLTRRGSLRSGR